MKCPECSKSIGIFSPALRRPVHERQCPHCQIPVRLTMDLKTAAVLLILYGIAAYLLLPVLTTWGVPRAVATVSATVLISAFSMRLVRRSLEVPPS